MNNINQINSAQQATEASWSQTEMEELVTPSYAASCFRRGLFSFLTDSQVMGFS